MDNWHDFFVATAGASAALLGFIFVSISINLKQILSYPKLPHRSLDSLLMPVTALVSSCCGLIPDQPTQVLGYELLSLGLLSGLLNLTLNRRMQVLTPVEYQRIDRLNLGLSQLTLFPYWLAGCLLVLVGWCGLYWLVAGIPLSFIKTVYDAWILLIAINR